MPVAHLRDVEVTPLHPQRFREVLSSAGLEEFEDLLARGHELLDGRTVWTVNSTPRGGGVAEMLRSLIGYVRGEGIDARWVVIDGDADFFRVTKRLHNHLHCAGVRPFGEREREIYERWSNANAQAFAERVRSEDVILLHDPQTAGMIPRLLETGAPVVWRAHIGVDQSNELARQAWQFLLPYVQPAHAYVFSRETFVWDGLDRSRVTIIPPSIDAFAPKNQAMSFTGVAAVLRASGLAVERHHPSRAVFERLDGSTARVQRQAQVIEEHNLRLDTPAVLQVSRWDNLKDPIGVIQGFVEHVHLSEEPHLVLAGPDVTAVVDDPEGAEVFAAVEKLWSELPRALRRRVHLALLPMEDPDENAVIVNALQRRADVVVQKSVAEGFGLTVAEAMWKGRPVVASAVGGIQDQIEDGRTGRLVEPHDLRAFGRVVSELLADPHAAERMGELARLRVLDLFLGPRHMGQYATLFARVIAEAQSVARRSA